MSTRPNLIFIMSDDHAAHALSCYGSRINTTPHLDRIADGGMRFDAAFCTNSICAPSRAAILTGTYNHVNGVTTLDTPLDNTLWTFPAELRSQGWQTAIFGKWHLGHGAGADPSGFDVWRVLPGQGHYHNPVFLEHAGALRRQWFQPGQGGQGRQQQGRYRSVHVEPPSQTPQGNPRANSRDDA